VVILCTTSPTETVVKKFCVESTNLLAVVPSVVPVSTLPDVYCAGPALKLQVM